MIRQISPNFTSKFTIYKAPGTSEKYFQNIKDFCVKNKIGYVEKDGSLGTIIKISAHDKFDHQIHGLIYNDTFENSDETK